MFSPTKFHIVINISQITFSNKPHLSSVTNVENLTRNFRQLIEICCREKEKEKNNGDCKAICVKRKLNK